MLSILHIAQIVVSVLLVAVILLQAQGTLGGIFGQGGSVYKTRRGFEKTLFQLTIALAILFVLISMASVRLSA